MRFDQPVAFYVENFLNFPVKGAVPAGSYDRAQAAWISSDNGRIVQMLSITDGYADLDIDGSGVAADAIALSALGVADAERQQLASLYQPGRTLWRVPIPHFTPWDFNWPYRLPDDAIPPNPPPLRKSPPKPPKKELCEVPGCIIEVQSQGLGEVVQIVGTPFHLRYQSDRVPGRRTAYTLNIRLSGASVPGSLQRITLIISVAGQEFTQTFPAAPNQRTTFTWDGMDPNGRVMQGAQRVTVRIGYEYGAVYGTPAQLEQSFGAFAGSPLSGNSTRTEITV